MACGSFFWERLPRLDGLRRGSRRHRMEALLQEEGLPSSPVQQEEDLLRQALESLPRSRGLDGGPPGGEGGGPPGGEGGGPPGGGGEGGAPPTLMDVLADGAPSSCRGGGAAAAPPEPAAGSPGAPIAVDDGDGDGQSTADDNSELDLDLRRGSHK